MNIGIIMDGNGRWAKRNSFNITKGHEQGINVVREIVEESVKQKISSLTLYAFSTENWLRPETEITGIKKLIIKSIRDIILLIEFINNLLSNLFLSANSVTIELCNGPLIPPKRTRKNPGTI